MFWRSVSVLLFAVVLGGCETERNGLDYSAMTQKIGPPAAGRSRIVVLREKGYGGITDPGWDVKLDGGPMADLKTGTYVYARSSCGPAPALGHRGDVPGRQPARVFHAGRPHLLLSDKSRATGRRSWAEWQPRAASPGLLVGAAMHVQQQTIPDRSISFLWRTRPPARQLPNCAWRRDAIETIQTLASRWRSTLGKMLLLWMSRLLTSMRLSMPLSDNGWRGRMCEQCDRDLLVIR